MQAKLFILIALTALVAAEAYSFLSKRPHELQHCVQTDEHFSKCLAANFQVILNEWKEALPGLGYIGSLDPLAIDRLTVLERINSVLSLEAELWNATLQGLSSAVINDAHYNSENMVLNMDILVPSMVLDSNLKVKGRVLSIELQGHGQGHFEADHVELHMQFGLNLRKSYDVTFIDLDTVKANVVNIGDFRLQLHNLFHAGHVVESAANNLLNAHWRDFYELLTPFISTVAETVTRERFQKVFSYIPATYFIADIEH